MKNIKSSATLITLFLILVSILFSSFTANLSALNFLPKIVFEEHDHDFGNVSGNQELMYNFRFKNDGEEKLIISNYMPETADTNSARMRFAGDKRTYEPGESGEVFIFCNTSGFIGENEIGFEIETNDKSNSVFRLHINFNITN